MITRWYYKCGDEVIGPISSSELLRRVWAQRIDRDTLVRAGVEGTWVRAAEIERLFSPTTVSGADISWPDLHEQRRPSAAMARKVSGEEPIAFTGEDESGTPAAVESAMPREQHPSAPASLLRRPAVWIAGCALLSLVVAILIIAMRS